MNPNSMAKVPEDKIRFLERKVWRYQKCNQNP